MRVILAAHTPKTDHNIQVLISASKPQKKHEKRSSFKAILDDK